MAESDVTEAQMIKTLKEWTKGQNMIDRSTFARCMKACVGEKAYKAIQSDVESTPWSTNMDKTTKKVNLDKNGASLVYAVGERLKPKKNDVEMQKAIVNKPVGPAATKFSATGGVGKMTDTSLYGGAHKERFDKDGKGKGVDGRVDKVDGSGYVGDYKNKDTYDKKH